MRRFLKQKKKVARYRLGTWYTPFYTRAYTYEPRKLAGEAGNSK